MNNALFVFSIIAIVCAALSLYFAFNTRSKVSRMNKRYNRLLRGYSDVNMEELLVQFGTNLSLFKKEKEEAEQKLEKLEEDLKKLDEEKTRDFNEKLNGFMGQITNEYKPAIEKMNSDIKRLDEQVYARMDQVEKENKQALDDFQNFVQNNLTESAEKLDHNLKKNEEDTYMRFEGVAEAMKNFEDKWDQGLSTEISQRTQSVEELGDQLKAQISTIDKNTKDGLQSMNIDLSERMDRLEKETGEHLKSQSEKQERELQKTSGQLKDRLSLAVSKLYLTRYDAFEELSGRHSFSLVMLDEHRDGVILTSIYSSEGSNIFCKTVKNGQANQALSQEESKALEKAIQQ